MLLQSQPLTDAMIALASGTAVPIVTQVVNVAKPLLEQLPWADPHNAADKPAHDATLQAANLLATVGVTLLMTVFLGYISDPSQLWIAAVQIVCITALADANYRGSHSGSSGGAVASAAAGSVALPAPSVASVASVLNAAIPAPASAPASTPAPLHQQALPTEPLSPAIQPATPQTMTLEHISQLPPDAAVDAAGENGALNTPTQPVPVVTAASAPTSAI